MKKLTLLAFTLVAMLISLPAMSQGTSLSTVPNAKLAGGQSNFIKLVESAGSYTQLQSLEAAFLKLASTSSLGGYTLRCEKFTDIASGKSLQAVKVMPNTQTGIGKMVSGVTGLGSATQIFYIDFDELPGILATIETMNKACETEPTVNTTYTYTTRGGFSFSLGYVVNAKKVVKLGQIGQTGEVPFVDFMQSITNALTAAQAKFAELK